MTPSTPTSDRLTLRDSNLLEFERRATTPKRIPQRLASYRRYFASGWAERDHGGRTPGVLFVFETPESETAFLDVADGMEGLDAITANAEALSEHGILGKAWILPPPHSLHRATLAGLYPVAQMQSAAPDLSCRGASIATNGQFCSHLPQPCPVTSPPVQYVAEPTRQTVIANRPCATRQVRHPGTNASHSRQVTDIDKPAARPGQSVQ